MPTTPALTVPRNGGTDVLEVTDRSIAVTGVDAIQVHGQSGHVQ